MEKEKILKTFVTDDESVIEFVRNYSSSGNGKNDYFFSSLQSYLSYRGYLTPKQIDAARPSAALSKLNIDKTCMWIEDGNPNSPSVKRMKSGGCKMIEIDGYLILWRD